LWQALDLLPKEQPSAAMRARFYQTLNSLTKTPGPGVGGFFGRWNFHPAQAAGLALAVFLLGIFVGHAADASRGSREVAQLRGEVQNMREMVALSLMERQSAGARLEGVSYGSRIDQPDRQVSSALLTALNHDANVNVRLSAVDALEKFARVGRQEAPSIRIALVDSIATQESPLVQIALIDTLVQIRDRDATPELKRVASDPQSNANVRQRAEWGIQKLGTQ
jgi:HEAT repeat protein